MHIWYELNSIIDFITSLITLLILAIYTHRTVPSILQELDSWWANLAATVNMGPEVLINGLWSSLVYFTAPVQETINYPKVADVMTPAFCLLTVNLKIIHQFLSTFSASLFTITLLNLDRKINIGLGIDKSCLSLMGF